LDLDAVLGIVLVAAGVLFLSYVVFWSRRTINIIAKKRLRSIREILNELKNGR
jgi:hypothetical protein